MNRWKIATVALAVVFALVVGGSTYYTIDLRSKLSTVSGDLSDTQAQLTSIQSKFPLRLFADKDALESWLAEQPPFPAVSSGNVTAELVQCRSLQRTAANDGWLISAVFYIGECTYSWYTTAQILTCCSAFTSDGGYYIWGTNETNVTAMEGIIGNLGEVSQ